MMYLRSILVLAITLFVAACASGPLGGMQGSGSQSQPPQHTETGEQQQKPAPEHKRKPQPQQQPQAQQTPEKAPPRSAAEISSPAVMSLLHSADKLAKAEQWDGAASVLERALNLDPRNPFIYQRLAAVYAAQGHYGQAEQMAMKSNSLAGGNPFVLTNNWKLIAAVRHATGNTQGQQEASAKAVNYQRATSQYAQ